VSKPVDAAAVDSEGRIFAVSRTEIEGVRPALHGFRLSASGRLDRTFGGGWVFLRSARGLGGLEVAAFAGQRPVFFEQGSPECSPDDCAVHPFLIRLRGGSSRVSCLGHEATIVGTRRGETLTGTMHRDAIAALAGADTVRGLGGDDLICGGRGDDTILDGPGRDRVRP
jgi:Ca2+-binding RTX toxin-like protein